MLKIVVITGAAGGIGTELCNVYGEQGYAIIALDNNKTALNKLSETLKIAQVPCFCSEIDISKYEDVKQAIYSGLNELKGELHVLINNAAINFIGPFQENAIEKLELMMRVNFMGSVNCTAVCKEAIDKNKGSIIAVSTPAGFAPLYHRTSYCATKYAVHGFFESLRTECPNLNILFAIPTYVKTNFGGGMNEKKGIKLLTPQYVAKEIYTAMISRKNVAYIGRKSYLAKKVYQFAPSLYLKLMLKEQKGKH